MLSPVWSFFRLNDGLNGKYCGQSIRVIVSVGVNAISGNIRHIHPLFLRRYVSAFNIVSYIVLKNRTIRDEVVNGMG